MRFLLLSSIIAFILNSPLAASAAEILIVQSQHRQVYGQVVRLVQNSCGSNSETLVVSDYAEFDLGRIVREEQPRLVIAIGDQAFSKARSLRRTPVVYALTLNAGENSLGNNITGVSTHVAPESYLKLFKKLKLHRIGILYDPRHSGGYLARANKAAKDSEVELVPLPVSSPREVPAALERLQNLSVDGLWMIPDSSVVAPESVDSYFRFARQQRLPVISFTKGYLAKGAVAVLEGSADSIAEQSCAIVNKIRSGVPVSDLPTADISGANLYINEGIAAGLQLKLFGPEQLFLR